MGFHDGLAEAMEKHGPSILLPNQPTSGSMRRNITLGWVVCALLVWWQSPWTFWPTLGETWAALHDMWFYQNLGVNLLSSLRLNLQAIALATTISLSLAYLGTIALAAPVVRFVGQLRFLSFAGMGFAFTLMIGDGYHRKIAVLVFMVMVYFVVAMMDVIRQIPTEQYDLARTLKMGPWETLWEVVILGQIDQAFIVLRQTAAMSWMFVSTAEMLDMSSGGVGMMLDNSNRHLHLSEVLALQLIVLTLGLLQDYGLGWLRNKCCPWTVKNV